MIRRSLLIFLPILAMISAGTVRAAEPGTGSPAAPLVMGETFTLESRALKETRRINVYLPPGYRESTDQRLPVLYMPDGGMAEDFLHIAGLVQVGAGNGTMRPMLLVGIENTERRRDLTGPTSNAGDRRIAPRVGGSAAFRQFIRDELMPAVNARYRTTGRTAIVGESLAGLFVVETLLLEPRMFDTYIAVDPSLWWNDAALVETAATRLKGLPAGRTLFMASSDEPEINATAKRFADILQQHAPASLRWHHETMPAEKHSTIFHPAALQAFRRMLPPE